MSHVRCALFTRVGAQARHGARTRPGSSNTKFFGVQCSLFFKAATDLMPLLLTWVYSLRLGATAAVTPGDAAGLAPFDIALEVTGNPRGLQVK